MKHWRQLFTCCAYLLSSILLDFHTFSPVPVSLVKSFSVLADHWLILKLWVEKGLPPNSQFHPPLPKLLRYKELMLHLPVRNYAEYSTQKLAIKKKSLYTHNSRRTSNKLLSRMISLCLNPLYFKKLCKLLFNFIPKTLRSTMMPVYSPVCPMPGSFHLQKVTQAWT